MHRDSVMKPDTGKAGPGTYHVGEFRITRARSRWRVNAEDLATRMEFATLGGAIAWCRQQSQRTAAHRGNPTHV